MRMEMNLDEIDLKILIHLQSSGRCSNIELAAHVGLSPSPCLARVKKLEDNGYIKKYGAYLEPNKFGDFLTLFTEVTISIHRRKELSKFEDSIRNIEEIVECYNISGGYDYLLKIVSRDMKSYQNIMDSILDTDIGIEKFSTYIVLRTPFVKNELPINRIYRKKPEHKLDISG